jgi:hypothetical protein
MQRKKIKLGILHTVFVLAALLLLTLSFVSQAKEKVQIYIPSFMRLPFVIESMNDTVHGSIVANQDSGVNDQQQFLSEQMQTAKCQLRFAFTPPGKNRRQQTKQLMVSCKGDEKIVTGYIIDSDGQTGISDPTVGTSAYAVFKEGFALLLDFND